MMNCAYREKETNDSDNSRRPTRKTKEYASIYLGLITKEFSSDENENSGKSGAEDSSGDTSSSETKFLENQYKAILKRDELKQHNKKKSEKSSKAPDKKHSNISKKLKKMPITKKTVFKKPGRKGKIPEKRILRSQSSRDESSRKKSDAAPVTRRRVTVPISPCDKPVHAGAARKSASVVPRKNTKGSSSSGSSSDSSSASSSSSGSDSDSEASEEPKAKKEKITPMPPRRRRTVSRTNETESKESDNGDSESDKNESIKKPEPIRQRSFSTSVTESTIQAEVSQQLESIPETIETSSCSSTSESDSDSSTTEEERVVEKVEIAIQVDMDLDDNIEYEYPMNDGYRQEENIPTPPFTPQLSFSSQGCQSNFIPPHSIPMSMPLPMPHSTPMSMPMPMPIPHSIPMSMPMSMSHPPPIQIPMPPQQPQHQQQPSFIPYSGPSFYPTLSNVEFVTQQRTQQDFSLMLPALSLPNVSGVPTYNFAPCSSVLTQNQIPMCFSSTSISAETTLQTHIRSVAANLDIPLVRPVVTPNSLLNLPLTRPTVSSNRPLTRPIMNVWSDNRTQQPNYSAFRVPISTGTGYLGQRLLTPVAVPTIATSQQPPQQYSMISTYNQNQFLTSISTPAHSTQSRNIQPAPRPGPAPPVNPTNTGVPGLSAHGLSLIQSLPNVSIVPKFHRTTKAVIIPPDQKPSASASTSSSVNSKSTSKKKAKDTPPKEKGRKRKSLSFPQPSSPLTVRKDSTTPATYVGVSSKK